MNWPPKKKHAPAKSALRKLRLQAVYRLAGLLANTCGAPFWFFEQKRGTLQDRIENEKGE